jgi:beta-phosphoglucomutase-like phosphatase (HAD superfamily)
MIENRTYYSPDSETKRPVDGVTFDFEGTVTRQKLDKLHWLAHLEVAKQFFGIDLDLNDPNTFILIPHLIGGPDVTVMDDLKNLAIKNNKFPNQIPEISEMLQKDKKVYTGLIYNLPDEDFKLDKDFVVFLEKLKGNGVLTALGTLTEANIAYMLLGRFKLAQLFEMHPVTKLVFFESVADTKPNPEVYYATAGRMSIMPSHQMVFEDSHNGIKSALLAGSIPIGLPTVENETIYERLRASGAVEIFSGWKEVRGDSKKLLNIEPE